MMMWSLWEPTEAALMHVEVGVLGGGEEDVDDDVVSMGTNRSRPGACRGRGPGRRIRGRR